MMRGDASPEGEFLTLRVTDTRAEAVGIRSFELRDPGGADLPPFEAGAHLQVEVQLPDGRAGLRQYSLLGDPRDRGRYRIAVLLEAEGRGGSRFMHERVERGSILRAAGLENGFPLMLTADHSILIAGGIGITPILSMVRALAQAGRGFELHYAARTPARMAFREEIEALAGGTAHFYHTHVEQPRPLDLEALLATPGPGAHAYVCGPPGLIRAVTSLGAEAGWPRGRIHSESFGPKRRAGDLPIEVCLERSALTLQVAPGETILDAILDAGVWAPSECRRGECASCMTRVVAGEPDHRDICLTPELQKTYMCPCVSRAHSSHLTLDL
ncbi:MAG: 2Fe-2S iron-sulfur cluster-binding protein [Gemmatimonadales bacterium]